MERRVKIVLVATIVALLIASAVFLLYPRDSNEPTVLKAHIIGFDSFNNYILDISEEQLHGYLFMTRCKC